MAICRSPISLAAGRDSCRYLSVMSVRNQGPSALFIVDLSFRDRQYERQTHVLTSSIWWRNTRGSSPSLAEVLEKAALHDRPAGTGAHDRCQKHAITIRRSRKRNPRARVWIHRVETKGFSQDWMQDFAARSEARFEVLTVFPKRKGSARCTCR